MPGTCPGVIQAMCPMGRGPTASCTVITAVCVSRHAVCLIFILSHQASLLIWSWSGLPLPSFMAVYSIVQQWLTGWMEGTEPNGSAHSAVLAFGLQSTSLAINNGPETARTTSTAQEAAYHKKEATNKYCKILRLSLGNIWKVETAKWNWQKN